VVSGLSTQTDPSLGLVGTRGPEASSGLLVGCCCFVVVPWLAGGGGHCCGPARISCLHHHPGGHGRGVPPLLFHRCLAQPADVGSLIHTAPTWLACSSTADASWLLNHWACTLETVVKSTGFLRVCLHFFRFRLYTSSGFAGVASRWMATVKQVYQKQAFGYGNEGCSQPKAAADASATAGRSMPTVIRRLSALPTCADIGSAPAQPMSRRYAAQVTTWMRARGKWSRNEISQPAPSRVTLEWAQALAESRPWLKRKLAGRPRRRRCGRQPALWRLAKKVQAEHGVLDDPEGRSVCVRLEKFDPPRYSSPPTPTGGFPGDHTGDLREGPRSAAIQHSPKRSTSQKVSVELARNLGRTEPEGCVSVSCRGGSEGTALPGRKPLSWKQRWATERHRAGSICWQAMHPAEEIRRLTSACAVTWGALGATRRAARLC